MFASFIIALLTGMGVGSGGLFVVYLTVIKELPQLLAQELNLYFFIFSTAAALILHSATHPLPLGRLSFVCCVGSIGCVLGAILAQGADASLLRKVFAVLLIVTGAISFLQKKKSKAKKSCK